MRRSHLLLGMLVLLVPLVFLGCEGDDGPQGPKGDKGDPGDPGTGFVAAVNPESCAICHDDENVRNGDAHQADYDERFQDNVIVVVPGSIVYAFTNNTHNVTFRMIENTPNGPVDFNCTTITTGAPADSLSIGFAEYNAATRSFDPPAPLPVNVRMSLGSQSTLSYLGGGVCRSTVNDNTSVSGVPTPVGDLSTRNGIIEINGRHDRQGFLESPSRVQLALHPFAGLLKIGTVDYVSAASVSGCEKCHTVPFLKHGFIYGRVNGDPATDFYTCKGCHMDNGPGGHLIWQLLVDNPQLAAAFEASGEAANFLTQAQKDQYAYKTRLMNDVHMSHAMEFAYPQSMSNCATCHVDKLNLILTDGNFVIETCKSCHPVTGGTDLPDAQGRFTVDTRTLNPLNRQAPALETLWANAGVAFHNIGLTCNLCHSAAGGATRFSGFHTGYDPEIYGNVNGTFTKYSSAITVTIDNASFDDNTNVLSWGFHATGSLGAANSTNIVPTVLVALYGYDTKHFLVNPHDRLADNSRSLEAVAGTSHPRITITSPAPGSWNVTANLSAWAGFIDNNMVKRVELGVLPALRLATLPSYDNTIALNAKSRTFNLGNNAFEDNYFQGTQAIVKVEDGFGSGGYVSGCNNCHDALATTFHSGARSGNIVICRMCHSTKNPGSALELQSRSIDSYAHAIHRFQAFEIGGIDFSDPVEALEYKHHVQSNFPTFGVENCRACHNAGKFNVPDQSKSLPGVLSNSDVATISTIPELPFFITGPATRACGACHRAEAIIANEGQGDPVKLANINSHMATFGYMVPIEPTPPAEEPTSAEIEAAWLEVVIGLFAIIL